VIGVFTEENETYGIRIQLATKGTEIYVATKAGYDIMMLTYG
jgi:hypothetical protein